MEAPSVTLTDIDRWPRSHAVTVLRRAWEMLPDHGILTMEVLDWDWVVNHGVLSDEDASMLFSIQRWSTWDALTIVKALMEAGFYKVWTGHVPEIPDHMLLVKALKVVKIPDL